MTATKKTVNKKTSSKKGSARKAQSRPARKASLKRASTKAKTTKKATTRKKSTKKSTAKKSTAKKAKVKKKAKKAKKTTTKKGKAKKKATKKATAKKASTKKKAAKKQGSKQVSARKKTAEKASSKKARHSKRSTKAKVVDAVKPDSMGAQESLDSIIDPDLLENFEGWETPAAALSSDFARSAEGGETRADREADFDELLEGEKPKEDWNSTSVFESDVGVESALNEAAEENVTVTSLVVVQEAKLAPVQECRIEQPVPDTESEFEEFAAEEIISILDESLAMDLEAAVQAEPKDAEPQTQETVAPPQALADEVEAVRPAKVGTAQASLFTRLWRLLISSE